MTASTTFITLMQKGMQVWVDNGEICLRGPKGALLPEDREHLALHKKEILNWLKPGNKYRLSSFAQQRLWFLDQFEPNSAFYNIPMAVQLVGELDETALRHTLNEIVQRHEVLRTSFTMLDGVPVQVIAEQIEVNLSVTNLTELPAADRERHARQLAQDKAQTPFDLSTGPLIHASLIRLDATDHILFFTLHHIVSDGWSTGVLIKEFAMLYTAYTQNQPAQLPKLPIQYADFAYWQRQWLSGNVLQQQLDYWKEQLSGSPTLLTLPTDRPRPAMQSYKGAKLPFEISAKTVAGLQALNKQTNTTLFMALTATFNILLARYSGQNDICIGVPIANRNRAETETLIGFFVNTLVLRAQINSAASFESLLQQVRATTLNAYQHQDVPFEQLVDIIKPERHTSHSPLFQVMLVLQNAPMQALELPGLNLQPVIIETTVSKFDLTLNVIETKGTLSAFFEYNTDLFNETTIRRMAEHFTSLLDTIVANPGMLIRDLPMVGADELHQLLVEWNATKASYPQNKCIHELFEAQVEKTPDAMAVIFEEQELTYAQLNARANQLAHYLRSQGVGPDILVGICVERSLEMVIGLLGILKAGGAYVPLDPNYPKNRLAYIINDSRLSIFLTQRTLVLNLPEQADHTIRLDADWQELIATQSVTAPVNITHPSNLAYVLFTSGTTGHPKGVALQHRNAAALIQWAKETYSADELSGILASTSIGFDLSIYEIFGTLTLGGCVILAKNVLQLPTLVAAERVRLINTVPSAMAELLRQTGLPGSVKTVNLAGEALSAQLVDELYRTTNVQRVIDAYGPTENTTYSTFTVRQIGMAATIGRPLPHWTIYILNNHLQPVPLGVSGELYIGGAGVARGYLNRPDLTAEKFIPNPFSNIPGERMYKSGDLARYLPDGNIEYLGRIDHQVKVRGFRIELGEIEAALMEHTDVQANVVIVREDTPGDPLIGAGKRLVAYVVSQQKLDSAELRSFIKARLPDYMLPSAFVFLENLPLTPNGKINRKALPAPDTVRNKAGYVAPSTPTEKALAQIWSKTLKLDKVGVHDNFFELGGDSLLGIRMVALSSQELLHITLKQIFQYQTIAELAAVASVLEAAAAEQQHQITGVIPLTAPQNWFFEKIGKNTGWGIHLWSYEVNSIWSQSPSLVAQVFKHLMIHHDELRAYFVHQETGWQKAIAEPRELAPFTSVNLANLDPVEQDRAIQVASDALHRELDVSTRPLVRILLFDLGDSRPARLLIIAHHLIWDGFTSGIVLDDFRMAYQQLARGELIQLPPKSTSVKEYVEYLQAYVRSQEMRQELDRYWLTLPWDQMAALPVDNPTGEAPRIVGTIDAVEVTLNAEETYFLQTEIPRVYQAQVSETILMALMQVMTRWTGRSHQLIGWVDSGRGTVIPGQADLDMSRTAGWLGFDRYLPLEDVAAPSVAESLQAIQEQLQRIPNHGVGWYIMRHYGDAEMVEKVKPLIRDEMVVMVNYLGPMIDPSANQFEIMRPVSEPKPIPCEPQTRDAHPRLFITAKIVGGCFSVSWEYNCSEYRRTTIERLAFDFKEALRALIVPDVPSI